MRTTIKQTILIGLALIGLTVSAVGANAAVRIALMDFSTDDNLYSSIQTAADFTSLVQTGLKDEAGVEWVERSQIQFLKNEFAFAEMMSGRDAAPVARGRMLGADWMITGSFSTDDTERRTLSFQVIDLKHADVLARSSAVLAEEHAGDGPFGAKASEAAITALRRLLAEARTREAQVAGKARVAFLFLANVSRINFLQRKTDVLAREFREALQLQATNAQFSLVEFPKAYQSTGESEMLADGMIESGPDSWTQTADLFVWGTYSITNAGMGATMESKVELTLNLWDGVSPPAVTTESLSLGNRGDYSATEAAVMLRRLVGRVAGSARKQTAKAESPALRRQVADSILKAYVGMLGLTGDPGINDVEKRLQAVHMLETACYFDPDSADARVLWITSRYGWWIDFGHDVKNMFWSKWRQSKAWGDYVERFGLKPATVPLPFPYRMQGIPVAYERSLKDVMELFPQWDSQEAMDLEDQWRKEGVHTWLVEAEAHGFPKAMPHELAFRWRKQLEAELAARKALVADYNSKSSGAGTSNPLNLQTTAPPTKPSMGSPFRAPATAAPTQAPTLAQQKPPQNPNQMVPAPAWARDFMSMRRMFRLYPPDFIPGEIKPEFQTIQFPSRYEVKVVSQMAHRDGKVWILAMDETSAASSDLKPDLADETLAERTRLWTLAEGSLKPETYMPRSLPSDINAFMFHAGQLWLAGNTVSIWDPQQLKLRKFGLADGLSMQSVEALTLAGGRIYAAGGSFEIVSADDTAPRWTTLKRPDGRLSHGTGDPFLLTGNDQALGYVAGEMFFQDLKTKGWTNLAMVKEARCFAEDGPMFWIGADSGLHTYEPVNHTARSWNWNSPAFLESPMISMVGGAFGGGSTLRRQQVDDMEAQILARLARLETDHRRTRVARVLRNEVVDPLHINSRIPGRIRALANDGDYLWVGTESYFGSRLLLVHKPGPSVVAALAMPVRDRIASLAVSERHVWIGTYYGDDSLLRLDKAPFMSVPKSQWLDLALSTSDRAALLRQMSTRDQALYAFFTGDDEQVIQLLAGLPPEKASIEEMLLLVWSCGVVGANDLPTATTWCEQLNARQPDSPWAKCASESLRAGQSLMAKFDHNQDQRLDSNEKQELLADAEALGIQSGSRKNLERHMEAVFKMCDQDSDQKLNRSEAMTLWQTIPMYFNVGMEIMSLRIRADTNKDSFIDAAEFKKVIDEVRRITSQRDQMQ